jgi:hypothetical protein
MLRWELHREPVDGASRADRSGPAGEAAAAPAGEVISALVKPGVGRYAPPPWAVAAERGRALRWRVCALGAGGEELSVSDWRALVRP